MPKKIKNCFYKNLTFEKLLEAHYRARKNKTYKTEIIRFELDLERNIINLLNNLKNGTYQIGEYRKFIIYEPKERVIKALPYIDRIVHQWYVENLEKARCSLTSWLGHSSHCNSYKLQKKILESCNFIYSNCTDEKILEQIMELMEKDYQKVY